MNSSRNGNYLKEKTFLNNNDFLIKRGRNRRCFLGHFVKNNGFPEDKILNTIFSYCLRRVNFSFMIKAFIAISFRVKQ